MVISQLLLLSTVTGQGFRRGFEEGEDERDEDEGKGETNKK